MIKPGGLLLENPENSKLKQFIDTIQERTFSLQDLPDLLKMIQSNDRFEKHLGVIGLRKVIGVDAPPIQSIIDSHVIPFLVEFMLNDDEPYLQAIFTLFTKNNAISTV